MYIPSLDPELIREEPVRVLNPIGFPQPASDITIDAVVSVGLPSQEIAARTGIAQISPVQYGESDRFFAEATLTAELEKSFVYHPLATSLTGQSQFVDSLYEAPPETVDAEARIDESNSNLVMGNPQVDRTRTYFLKNAPKQQMLITFALPYRPSEIPDVRLRLYLRPQEIPLLSADSDVVADPIISPTVAMESVSRLIAYIPGKIARRRHLKAHIQGSSAFGEAAVSSSESFPESQGRFNARLTRWFQFGSLMLDRFNLWGNITIEERAESLRAFLLGKSNFGGPVPLESEITTIEASALSGTNLTATIRSRPIYVTRCDRIADTRTVTFTEQPVDDPTSPTVPVSIENEGFVTVNLRPLLQDDVLVYTLRISTSDPFGFQVVGKDPVYPDREPSIIFGNDVRSPSQSIRGAYLGLLLDSRQDTIVPLPVPFFSTSEARRLAQEWNVVSQYSVNPDDRYRLEFDSTTLRFIKYLVDEVDGEFINSGTIDPVRVGDNYLYPLGSYDFLWTLDKTDAISKLSNKMLAASAIEADPELLGGFYADTFAAEAAFAAEEDKVEVKVPLARVILDSEFEANLSVVEQPVQTDQAGQSSLAASLSKGDLEADASTDVSAKLRTNYQLEESAESDLNATLSTDDGEDE